MKLFIVAAIIGACVADRLDNKYLPPRGNSGAGYGGSGFGGGAGGSGFGGAGGAGFKGAGGFGGTGGFGGGAGGFSGGAGGFGGNSGAGGFGGQGGHSGAGGFGGQGGHSGGFSTQHAGNAYNAAPQAFGGRQNSADANAQILRSNSEVTAEGFSYDFETSNGIRADASGVATNGVQSQGSFGYKGDDGQDYSITYTADENGYQPQGAHLPTPPPIPEAILKSLEQNARDEAAGISDDGTYRGEGAGAGGYSGASAGGYSSGGAHGGFGSGGAGAHGGFGAGAPGAPSSQYGAPSRGFGGASQGGFGGASQGGFGGSGQGGFGGASQGGFGGASQGGFGAKQSNFGAAASRQYLAPNAGRTSGNGNFNAQSGYRY